MLRSSSCLLSDRIEFLRHRVVSKVYFISLRVVPIIHYILYRISGRRGNLIVYAQNLWDCFVPKQVRDAQRHLGDL